MESAQEGKAALQGLRVTHPSQPGVVRQTVTSVGFPGINRNGINITDFGQMHFVFKSLFFLTFSVKLGEKLGI